VAEAEVSNMFDLAEYDYSINAWKKSREAAVRVEIDLGGASVGGSGTYFKIGKHNVVVTAAHLFMFSPGRVLHDEAIITTPHEKVVGTLVYIDDIVDIAIIKVPSLDSRDAAAFKRVKKYEVGESVVYSGFPGANNLLTFSGTLIGEGFGTDLAMQSVAWGGSSGSGVFDLNGRFVGVLVSIMMAPGVEGTPTLLESVVYVAPANLIDSAYLKYNLDKVGRDKNEGF
tara:strand:+ start:1374 stop:2054 length:681 start_codon:yes stop_codon:yes gene_type:complete